MDILYIDHYDSFTYNILDWIRASDPSIRIHLVPFDEIDKHSFVYEKPMPIVLSPGPGHPKDMLPTIKLTEFYLGKVPIFGICLGHQILAHIAGFDIARSDYPAHGMTKQIYIKERNHFLKDLPNPFEAASYHSLIAKGSPKDPNTWKVSLLCSKGEIQGITSCNLDFEHQAFGVQFHPESFLSKIEFCKEGLGN